MAGGAGQAGRWIMAPAPPNTGPAGRGRAKALRDAGNAEALTVIIQQVGRLAEVAHAARASGEINATTIEMHIKQCTEDREEGRRRHEQAMEGRGRLYEKVEVMEKHLNKKIEAAMLEAREHMATVAAGLQASQEAYRGWTIRLILGMAGSLILLLLSVIAWLLVRVFGQAPAALPLP